MSKQFDLKKEWEKTKVQLLKFSNEAAKLAKQGEKEIVKFSKKGKAHIDSTAYTLKKEHLYHLIGKEYSKLKNPHEPSSRLNELMAELRGVEKEHKKITQRLKAGKESL